MYVWLYVCMYVCVMDFITLLCRGEQPVYAHVCFYCRDVDMCKNNHTFRNIPYTENWFHKVSQRVFKFEIQSCTCPRIVATQCKRA